MGHIRISQKIKIMLICFLVTFLILGILFYKPPLKSITDAELNDIEGIKVTFVDGQVNYGVISSRIIEYIKQNPDCKVDDLRIVKGVDDMIIDQLKKEFR